jgi:hypothetical protein
MATFVNKKGKFGFRNLCLNILLLLLSSLLTLELLSFIGTKLELLIFNDTPSIYVSSDASVSDANFFSGRTYDAPWGPWRRPNSVDRHITSCFDAIYKANSFGARDGVFTLKKSDSRLRYILLGDSFAEGWTVNIEDTVQARLEQTLGVDIYNFGISGFVGPVEYYLIYKDLAKRFEHDGVIVFFLPENDFSDNDYNGVWKKRHLPWYRPYYKKEANGTYSIFYPEEVRPGVGWLTNNEAGTLKKWRLDLTLKKYTYASNLVRTIKYLFAEYEKGAKFATARSAKYFSAPLDEQEAAIYFLEKIIDESAGKTVVIVVIPDINDLTRIKSSNQSYMNQYWYRTLKSFEQSKPNTMIIDLAPAMLTQPDRLFHTCDGHWSQLGNRVAADIIGAQLRSSIAVKPGIN